MKTFNISILYGITIVLVLISCKKSEIPTYSGDAKIQFIDSVTTRYSFIYEGEGISRDTVFIPIRAIGGLVDYDREIKLVQTTEYKDEVRFDPETNQPIDTIQVPVEFAAEAGVHYIGFDDPDLQKMMVMKAGQVEAEIPVVILRDASLSENSYRLHLELQENSFFSLGEKDNLSKTLVFSDRFERFYSWRFDNTVAPAFSTFGKYSAAKHQFMYEVIGEPIDENWYQQVVTVQAQAHYKNMIKQALSDFNNNPENIAMGLAPLREGDASSPLVTFP